MSEIYRQSPLFQLRHAGRSSAWTGTAGIHLDERAFAGHMILRGDSEDLAFCQAAADVLNLNLPLKPNSVVRTGSVTVFWLAPDEWLIITLADQETTLIQRLREGLAGLSAAVTDVSSAQTVIILNGENAADVVTKGCSVDLAVYLSAEDQCTQTLFAKASVLLWRSGGDTFEIVIKRSFAAYLWQWLEDAAAEYGVVID